MFAYKWIDLPVGRLKLIASEKGLAAVLWDDEKRYADRFEPLVEEPGNAIREGGTSA